MEGGLTEWSLVTSLTIVQGLRLPAGQTKKWQRRQGRRGLQPRQTEDEDSTKSETRRITISGRKGVFTVQAKTILHSGSSEASKRYGLELIDTRLLN